MPVFLLYPLSLLLSYFIFLLLCLVSVLLAVPMRECLGKHSCMSSSFPIAILNGTGFFPSVQLQLHNVYSERRSRNTCALVNLYLWTKLTPMETPDKTKLPWGGFTMGRVTMVSIDVLIFYYYKKNCDLFSICNFFELCVLQYRSDNYETSFNMRNLIPLYCQTLGKVLTVFSDTCRDSSSICCVFVCHTD